MHAVVMESLEEYLSGTLKPAALRDIEAHLNTCEKCRLEVAGMQQVSQWFGAIKTEEELTPGARVLRAGDAAGWATARPYPRLPVSLPWISPSGGAWCLPPC